ncbi:presenilin-associated rhomboid-like protein, mitochondrial isoform X1 [Daphnia carinata]|uniref:presenilin-associated rhomboid-like protein, mitochondrial isoform X1 n=1 Tax=Daphnia carinata TaxID=120202 RepID=UPI00257ACA06|nr:presenilin-associated rhomboid-like protein, mitochondrial isoform X1 [Daphnia carinata]
MQSLQSFRILVSNRPHLPAKSSNLRQIFFTGGKWTGRGGSSRLQPNRRVELTPAEPNILPEGNGRLIGPIFFTVGFTGSCLSLAAIWEYENMRKKALQFKQKATGWIQRQQNLKHGDLRNHMNHWWNSQTEEQKLFYGILLANATVLLAWRIPSLKNFMTLYFCSNPFARAVCWPMVFSTFSHYSFLHFGANMYVLQSFMNATAHSMGKEQFLGFYLSAGVVSSLASHIFKTALRMPGLSLGASGAVMGVLAYFCSQHPNALLQVAFVPGFTFTADSGLKALLSFDAIGLVMRWKLFDHAAHLGGALFGLFWSYWGQKEIWGRRVHFLQVWHEFRTGTRSDK